MSKTLPSGWEEKTLGEVCEIISGTTPDTKNPKYWNGDNYWITPAELTEDKIFISDCRRKITDLAVQHCSLHPMPKGTVIFSSRAPIGKLAISNIDTLYCNQGFKNFVCSKVIHNKFLYYFLKLNTPLLMNLGNGTTFKEISKSTVSKVHISFPTISEQKRIAGTLDKIFANIDKAKENTKKNLQNAKEVFESFLNSIFTYTLTGWTKKRIDEICENLDSKRIPITKNKRISGKIPYYGASGIVDYVKDYIFDEDLLLVSEDGGNLIMRTYPIAFHITGKTWVNNHAHVLKFDDEDLEKLTQYYLNWISLEKYISGAAQPKLNQAALNSIEIPFPQNIEEQKKIVAQLDALRSKTQELEQIYTRKLADLDELKQSILQQAFSGKL